MNYLVNIFPATPVREGAPSILGPVTVVMKQKTGQSRWKVVHHGSLCET